MKYAPSNQESRPLANHRCHRRRSLSTRVEQRFCTHNDDNSNIEVNADDYNRLATSVSCLSTTTTTTTTTTAVVRQIMSLLLLFTASVLMVTTLPMGVNAFIVDNSATSRCCDSSSSTSRIVTTINAASRIVNPYDGGGGGGDGSLNDDLYNLEGILQQQRTIKENEELAEQQNEKRIEQRRDILAKRRQIDQVVALRSNVASRATDTAAATTISYRVQIPMDQLYGITLGEVFTTGRFNEEEEMSLVKDSPQGERSAILITTVDPRQAPIGNQLLSSKPASNNAAAVIVKSMDDASSPFATAGVQVGDVITHVSATLGSAVWPTSTLSGIQSALSSRKLTSRSVTFVLQRSKYDDDDTSMTAPSDNQNSNDGIGVQTMTKDVPTAVNTRSSVVSGGSNTYELKLTRPLGFSIGESTKDGYVVVTDISTSAPKLVRFAVQVGDRVVAIDSSLGEQFWPVSTVEGVTSAVTSRLPGQNIRMLFERTGSSIPNLAGTAEVQSSTSASDVTAPVEPVLDQNELRKRCRDALRKYNGAGAPTATAMQKVPKLVADKVIDALAAAGSSLDAVTLSMLMHTYIRSDEPESAIRIFEASTGFCGDGSYRPAKEVIVAKKSAGQIIPTDSAVNLFTGTALMQAQAKLQNPDAVLTILAALEGNAGVRYGKVEESAPWPWTGVYGTIKPDAQCYNIAMRAVGIDAAEDIFNRIPNKSTASYNTLIRAYCQAGMADEAFGLLAAMKSPKGKFRPDKFTYTSLIKVCRQDGDIQELLYDMRENGVKLDIVTYNSIIRALCGKQQWTQASRLVTEMESSSVAPDSKTYGLLMNGMLRADKAAACLALFESACANASTSALVANVYIYTTAITAASALGDSDRAIDYLARMTANGIKPNVRTITAVMGSCIKSDKPELAAQLYERLSDDALDAYAMTRAIRAYCDSGDLEKAAGIISAQVRGRKAIMTGKQMMLSYQQILYASLHSENFGLARRMVNDLLQKGYIPSKKVLFTLFSGLGFNFGSIDQQILTSSKYSEAGFCFLLFVIDSLQRRNLPIEGILYVSTLVLGKTVGGTANDVVALMARSRTELSNMKLLLESSRSVVRQKTGVEARLLRGWEDVHTNFDTYKSLPIESLASIPVRIVAKDVGRVLQAEKVVFGQQQRSRRMKLGDEDGEISSQRWQQ